jgi:hypothetical protein
MDNCKHFVASLSHFIHQQFIWFLVGSYTVAAFFPALGLWMRDVSLGEITLVHERTRLSLPALMLALLLLNAGLGVQICQLSNLLRSPWILASGLGANLLIPIGFILAVTQGMRFWHNPDEVQNILVGLALVASMPIAGASTAWSQNANGNVALSLGLVLFSTFLSPLTTPLALHSVGFVASGDYAQPMLHRPRDHPWLGPAPYGGAGCRPKHYLKASWMTIFPHGRGGPPSSSRRWRRCCQAGASRTRTSPSASNSRPVITWVQQASRSTSPATGAGTSQSRAVLSQPPVRTVLPSGLKATTQTVPL